MHENRKKCRICGIVKSTDEFCKDSSRLSGISNYCKKCKADYSRNWRKELKESKFKAIHNGLSAIAKKVYEAVPIKDSWEKHKIILELQRLHPSVRDQHTILGCLDTLVRSGLVNQLENGTFRREHVETAASLRAALDKEIGLPEKMKKTEVQEDQAVSPIEKITRLQQMAAKIIEDVKAMSDAIETVAIEVEMQFSERDAESQKLKQLQALLKGLV